MPLYSQLSRWIFGKKLESTKLSEEKYSVFWGMPVLSSDAISSVAYAVEEMLFVLVPLIGIASYLWMPRIAIAIIILLFILIFSYRQVVDAYPGGGGAYVVSKENLNPVAGLIAGASLSVDYVLTVAVSISAGTAAITSAFPHLYTHRVAICVAFILFIAIANVRGVRESSRIFGIPTYAFIIAIASLVLVGIYKYATGVYVPPEHAAAAAVPFGTQAVTLFMLLRAFASGCAALTGVEAISNAVPNFKEPSARNAKLAYTLLAASALITFGGVAFLARVYHAVPNPKLTVIAQIAADVFGRGSMFYFIQATTAIILAMAANTAFAGFPTLLSIIAQDRYVPRQFAMRGHRLNYSNGIAMLAFFAIILIVVFQGHTHLLIPLYAVGVFTSFTLSQMGLLMNCLRNKPDGWLYKAFINGTGTMVTFLTVIIIAVTKFTQGAWVVVLVIPMLVLLMLGIKNHYVSVAQQLDIPNDFLDKIDLRPKYNHHVIVPIESVNVMVIKALRYAVSLTSNVEAFHVEIYEGQSDKLRKKWETLNTNIPLIIKQSPYREVIGPLVEYIDSEEHDSKPGDIITVLLPQFFVTKWWHYFLHNNTSLFIANAMFNKRNVVVSVMPFYLEDMRKLRQKLKLKHYPNES